MKYAMTGGGGADSGQAANPPKPATGGGFFGGVLGGLGDLWKDASPGGGADSGQAANPPKPATGGGFFGGVLGGLGDLWKDASPAGLMGGGVVGEGPVAAEDATNTWTKKLTDKAKNATLGGFPGYGELWELDGGLKLTGAGKIAAVAAGLAVAWLLLGRK